MNSAIENMPVAYTKLMFPKNRSKPVHISKENKLSPYAKLTFPKNRTKTDRKTDRQTDRQTDTQPDTGTTPSDEVDTKVIQMTMLSTHFFLS